MIKNSNPLVSIVVPVYNAEAFLGDTITTVQQQTYPHWELIMVDDASTDNSVAIIAHYAKQDARIKLIQQSANGGAARARNVGINNTEGEYIAFLDADDLWTPHKLQQQVEFAQKNHYAFTFADYEFADENGLPNGKVAQVPPRISYKEALKKSYIFTSTVMLDATIIDKKDIHMAEYTIGEDITTWWRLLRKYSDAYSVGSVLAYYRRTPGSLSANKLKAARGRWALYRKHERINFFTSLYYFFHYAYNAISRRV